MYTNYNSNLEKNQMMTPPIIGLTSSIVNDKLNNIKLEDNSTGLFKIEDSKIKPIVEMPIETNNFIISGTDDEIDSNENNAVNKRYLVNKCVGKDDQTITFNTINTKRIKFLNDNGNLVINTTSFSFPHGDSRIYFPAICLNNIFYILNDRIFTDKPISLYTNTGIEFNTNANGEIIDSTYQKTSLKNLVTSEITTELRKQLILNNLMDNVCPTYKFCENNYAKSDDINFVYETLDTKVNNDYLTTNYYDKTTVDNKFTENQFDSNNYYTKTEIDAKFPTVSSNYNFTYTNINKTTTYDEEEKIIYTFDASTKDVFKSNDTSKFYIYHVDLNMYTTRSDGVSPNTEINKIKQIYLKTFNNKLYFNWYKEVTSGSYYIKGNLVFPIMGDYNPTNINLCISVEVDETITKVMFSPTVSFKRREL